MSTQKPDARQVAGFGPTFFNLCNVTLGAGILSYPVSHMQTDRQTGRQAGRQTELYDCQRALVSASSTRRQ